MADAPRATLVSGPVGSALFGLALPMSIGIVFLVALNLVDTYFVGQLGTDELAAMSFTFPVIMLVISVALGLSVGTTSAVARAIGAGDEAAVRRLTTHALLLAGLIVAAVSLTGVLAQDVIFTSLGAEPELLPKLSTYMTIWFGGSVFLVVPMVANGVIRAGGDAKTPMYLMIVAALVNGALDPILIFGWFGAPKLELAGAAIATLCARSVTFTVGLWLLKRRGLLDFSVPSVAALLDSWKKIVSVGVPAAITNALGPVAAGVMLALIAREGSEAVAAYGVGSRVEGLLMIAPWGLTSALTPFIGQNWGAHREDRVARAIRLSNAFVLSWGTAAWLLLLPLAGLFASLFTADPRVIEATRDYLWIVPLSYGASGVVSVASAAFNAVDRAVRSTVLSTIKSLGLAVPLAYLGSELGGLRGLFGGIAVATGITAVIATIWARPLVRPSAKKHEPELSRTAVKNLSDAMKRSFDALLERLEQLPELEIRPRPINTIGFYVHGRELGHVHRTGHIDLHVPPTVGAELMREGLAAPHRLHPETCWITHRLGSDADAEEAAWLVNLQLTIGRAVEEGLEVPEVKAKLAIVDDRLEAAVRSFVEDVHACRESASVA